MSPKRPPLTASQPSSVADLCQSEYGKRPWSYRVRNAWQRSEDFKTREEATSAALDRGFAAVMFDGVVVARRPK